MIRLLLIALALILLFLLALYPLAHAQSNHAQHHTAHYQNWINQADKGCCNDRDCGELADENERTTAVGIEVKIEGQWCPVLAQHYLKKGNAPDWSTAHVCVRKPIYGEGSFVCERLLCYQPKPGI